MPSWQKKSSNLALSSISHTDQQLGGLEITKSKSYMANGTASSSIRKYSAGLMLAAGGSGFEESGAAGGENGHGVDGGNEEVDKNGDIGAHLLEGLQIKE